MAKRFSLNLSTEAILRNIYSASALYSINKGGNTQLPPILTRDNEPSLRLLVKDAFAFVTLKFVAYVESCNINGETEMGSVDDSSGGEMILQVDLRVGDDTPSPVATVLRVALERAIAAYSLHICFLGHDEDTSGSYLAIANEQSQKISQLLFDSPRIKANY